MATVIITPEARSQFLALPKAVRSRIEKVFVRLSHWPTVSGAKALSSALAGHYRIRTGDYRVQFRVEGPSAAESRPATDQGIKVIVEKVGHRERFYED